jgi:hypothetical protein
MLEGVQKLTTLTVMLRRLEVRESKGVARCEGDKGMAFFPEMSFSEAGLLPPKPLAKNCNGAYIVKPQNQP